MKNIGRIGTLCHGLLCHRGHRCMSDRLIAVLVASALLSLFSSPVLAGAARSTRKLIETGWGTPDTKALRENIAEMEKRPFDGVFFTATGTREDGKPCRLRGVHCADPWKQEWFQSCVDDLKATTFTTFTDNFLTIGANPGNVDWFDDAGWSAIVEHWRIAAWLAKQGGVKGVGYDPEPYSKPYAQFRYAAQPEKDKHTLNEYYEKARQRGREVMAATVAEFPDLTFFCYFMHGVNFQAAMLEDPRSALLAGSGYGLFPAFIDGWLDAAPPDVTFVDGCEKAYRFNSEMEFYAAAVKIKGACQQLVAPENRAKYRAEVQVSFGIYLDAYCHPETSRWYIDGKGGPRVNRLLANTACGLDVADEYVWMYGEKNRWWPVPNRVVVTWPEALPGSEDALRWARDPADFARDRIAALRQAGTLVNLARNGDFGAATAPDVDEGKQQDWKDNGAPAGWNFWQPDKSRGVFAWDRETGAAAPGAARAANVENGCFIQTYPVKPGERYAVHALSRCQGRSSVWIRVRWQSAEHKWIKETQDVILSPGAAATGARSLAPSRSPRMSAPCSCSSASAWAASSRTRTSPGSTTSRCTP